MIALAPRPPKRRTEATVQAEVRLALNRLPYVTIWRNARGYDEGRRVTYGLCPGAADLVGVLTVRGIGVALFVELKSVRGALEADQITFREVVLRLRALHVVARSADEAVAAVIEARRQLAARLR